MRFTFLFLILFISIQSLRAQFLFKDPSENTALYNPIIIKALHITSASVKYSYKYDMKTIRSSGEGDYYRFSREGRVAAITEVREFKGRIDTVISEYFRNKEGLLSAIARTDLVFTTVLLTSFLDGKLSRQQFYQLQRTEQWNEKLRNDNMVWADSADWKDDRASIFNQYNFLYKTIVVSRNTDGVVTSESHYEADGKLVSTFRYTWEGGKLTSTEEESGKAGVFGWRKEFLYGTEGLTEVRYFKSGELQYVRRITYNQYGLPELDLNRNEKTGKMIIARYEYSGRFSAGFFPPGDVE